MKNIILVLSLVILGDNAYAREKVGNGGGGFACKDKDGKIISVHLLDIFEGRNPLYPRTRGYQYPVNAQDPVIEIERAVQRASVNTAYVTELRKVLEIVKASIEFLPENTRLEPTEDMHREIGMKDCEFVQIANYVIEEGEHHRVDVIGEYYSKMSPLDQAGLLIHEAVYAISRKYSLDDHSVRSRRITAMLMAEDALDMEINIELSRLIAEPFTKSANELIRGCKSESKIKIVTSIEGKKTDQLLYLVINDQHRLQLKVQDSIQSATVQLPCQEFKSMRWTTYGTDRHFTVQLFLDETFLFGASGKTNLSLDTGAIAVNIIQ